MNGQSTIGAWLVDWDAGWIRPRSRFWVKREYPDARVLAVLELLAKRHGQVVSVEEMLEKAWPGRVVSADSVSTAIYQLRQLLGDDSQRSRYIKTEARRGYRLIATVKSITAPRRHVAVLKVGVFVAGLAAVGVAWSVLEPQKQPMLMIEPMQFEADGIFTQPLHIAIENTLLGELVNQLPGRVILNASPVSPAYTLQSAIVACDLGPALLVRLIANEDSRFLWAQAYRIDEWAGGPTEPTLVQTVAQDVGGVIREL